MCKQQFIVIGLDDNREQYFPPEILAIINAGNVFSGGKRHQEIMLPYLPEQATWIPITVPLNAVFEAYQPYQQVIVFASGDPLFFGFANTLRKRLPGAALTVYPTFNSLQLLAHRRQLPYQEMRMVSLTGRPWNQLDEAVIAGEQLIGVLTDRNHTPATIASRLLHYGYDNYQITVGEQLGNKEKEQVREMSLEEAVNTSFCFPNNLILQKIHTRPRPLGIPDNQFALLDGRTRMITKMPVRLLSLSMLELRDKKVFWDIGFCTGSVSVEARLQFPQLAIYAFEQREERAALLEENMRRFGTPGIHAITGDFTQADISHLPTPDAVFIGGHSGKMQQIVSRIAGLLPVGGTVVFNSVSPESKALFIEAIQTEKLSLQHSIRLKLYTHNTIEILKAIKTCH
ncbi:MAG: precorrin-6y C5,15-methyltransferase (decarboxylating) subunit CbiE [Tannerellaceae bacterium]|nr:precorrin-6y C5,15-methyltransferase (decarboxylating) subunit CbiE [Tannerellaceae bacterium]